MDQILEKVAGSLREVPGIHGAVLGGSRARGSATPDSDIDVGIYYGKERIDLPQLERAARKLDDEGREGLLSPPGGWGPWVDGGAWLVVEEHRVDLILRDFARVERVVEDCRRGIVAPHYQTGHPHAYVDAAYMGELAVCRVLFDKTGEVARLKAIAEVYPPALKKTIVRLFSFEAGFSQMLAEAAGEKDDAYYVCAHIVRSVSCLNQVLFALNGRYFLNEKRAVKSIGDFPTKPANYKGRVDEIFALAGTNPPAACAALEELVEEVRRLAEPSNRS